MKRLRFALLLVLFCSSCAMAQTDSLNRYFLDFRGGGGYGLYRDFGAAPFTFTGVELAPGIAFVSQHPQWRWQVSLDVVGGMYGVGSPTWQISGGVADLSAEYLYRLGGQGYWQWWVGGGVDDLFDMRYNAGLSNADMGFSNFLRVNMLARIEYVRPRWMMWGQMGLSPMALMLRPGFAYIDNFNHILATSSANLFDEYHWYLAGAVGMDTELGVSLLLSNGNRVGLAYQWHHATSHASVDGVSAPYRFDQASHLLRIHLQFCLK